MIDLSSSQMFAHFHLIIFPGAYLGTVFSLPLSGYLCSSTFLGGWPSVFYIFGKHMLSFLINFEPHSSFFHHSKNDAVYAKQ